jgi:hypothetical protein
MLRALFALCEASPVPVGVDMTRLLLNAVHVLLALWGGGTTEQVHFLKRDYLIP